MSLKTKPIPRPAAMTNAQAVTVNRLIRELHDLTRGEECALVLIAMWWEFGDVAAELFRESQASVDLVQQFLLDTRPLAMRQKSRYIQ